MISIKFSKTIPKGLILFCFFSGIVNFTMAQEMIPLWPDGKMPNSKGLHLPDSIAKGFLFSTTSPRIYAFPAAKENNTGAAVLIVPGGGYLRLPSDYSKNATALFYQSKGINAFVLCHRLPDSKDLIHPEKAPLQDAQRAMRIIRANASRWSIDPDRVGVAGTSAGGHVASTLGTHQEDVSTIGDSLDQYSFKPTFMILVSGVISFKEAIVHKGSRDRLIGSNPSTEMVRNYSNENQVTKETPTTLLIHGDNDKTVPSLNSLVFYQALHAAGVPASIHIFPYGGHGYTVNKNPGTATMWPSIAMEWLKEMKMIPE
ncbi:MAG TPA: alpha/beta hydrolase [Niabella sp.]|nr:alpha/beta hydrolase [Niabella sp.]HOZ97880.1 alpha/beta hydrolase [Niabella sp.]HQW13739.1 alpha/beta hydrolase [Niabella sp.]HQX19134.1 alpha/beta hydrolase [Niabella sp.]HQX42047.1 alpha/beta hydrolase [Niabella sp.]